MPTKYKLNEMGTPLSDIKMRHKEKKCVKGILNISYRSLENFIHSFIHTSC